MASTAKGGKEGSMQSRNTLELPCTNSQLLQNNFTNKAGPLCSGLQLLISFS